MFCNFDISIGTPISQNGIGTKTPSAKQKILSSASPVGFLIFISIVHSCICLLSFIFGPSFLHSSISFFFPFLSVSSYIVDSSSTPFFFRSFILSFIASLFHFYFPSVIYLFIKPVSQSVSIKFNGLDDGIPSYS